MAAPLGRCCCRALVQNKRAHFYRSLSSSSAAFQLASTQNSDGPKIIVPKRKQRTPTSILEALASTVQKDYNAPHYRYVDDPYLIPASSVEKRTYSLSRASGHRAADYAMANFPKGFLNDSAIPSIPDFMPELPLQHAEDSLAGLQERLERKETLPAFQCYQALKEAGTAIPDSALTSLLELMCFYNSEEPSSKLLPDEQYFQNDPINEGGQAIRKTWKSKGPAEQLFEEIKNKTPEMYLSLLKGRAKYFDMDGAWDLFTEMKQGNIAMCADTFNAIIRLTPYLRDSSESRWDFIMELMADMASRQVAPNLATFNSALYAVSRCFRFRRSRQWVLQLIQEMKDLNIEPSLGSWYYVIRTVYGSDDVTSDVLTQIIDYLEGKTLEAQDPADYEFFSTAMVKCYTNLKDLELAYKIDNLLNTDTNVYLLGGAFKQGIYYTFFLRTLCTFEQIDKIMENYERITPHVYTPTFSAYDELLRAIELNEGYQHLPHIWSDLVLFDYTRRTDLIEHLLNIMGKKKQDPELQSIYLQISQYVLEKFEEEKLTRRLRPFQLTGTMIGELMQISINSGDFLLAKKFFSIYQDNKMNIERFPSETSLVTLSNTCIEEKDAALVLQCLQLMADCAYPKVDTVAANISKGLELTQDQKNFIDDLL